MTVVRRAVEIDRTLMRAVVRLRRPAFTWALRRLTRLGNPESYLVLAVLCLALGQPRWALKVGLGAGGGAGLSFIVKRLVNRRRPALGLQGYEPLVTRYDPFSFPSGHTASSIGLAVAWADEGPVVASVTALLAALVSFSRVYLGAHYPLDVAAGAGLGIGCGLAAHLMLGGVT